MSRLTARVARHLADDHAEVTVVGDAGRDAEAVEIASLIDETVRILPPGRDRDEVLMAAGVRGADAVLVVGEDDLDNLRYAADAHELAPDVPVVLRTFQPELAERVAGRLNIRRAYSVASLAAPAFVAASVGEEVVETLRLRDEEVPLCVLDVHGQSLLADLSAEEAKARTKCAVVAVRHAGGEWRAVRAGEGIDRGDQVLVGGRLLDVLALAVANQDEPDADERRRARHRQRLENRELRAKRRTQRAPRSSLLPLTLVAFVLLAVVAGVVNYLVLGLDLYSTAHLSLGTGLGNTPPPPSYFWLGVFNFFVTVVGVVLGWAILSHITAVVLAERLDQRNARRASKLRDHVVVVGLGRVGYRVTQLLADLGVPAVVIEPSPDSRFLEAISVHTPVLEGDGRLPENLQRAGITRARCILACTTDDLANLTACLEAKGLNPDVRTVSRVFDETIAGRLRGAFGIDELLSSTEVAASAFLGASTDALARRAVELDGLSLLAFRFGPDQPVSADTMERWRRSGLRFLAVARDDVVGPPTVALSEPLRPGDETIVIGPSDVVTAFAGDPLTLPADQPAG